MPPPRTTRTISLSFSQPQYTSNLFYSSSWRVIHAHSYHELARRTRPRPRKPHHHHDNAPTTNPNPTSLPRRHPFSTSTPTRNEHAKNYYEILEIPITATTQEIKKYLPLPPHTNHHTNPVLLENSTPSPSATTRTATETTQQQAHASRKSQPPTPSSSTPINAPRTTRTMGFTTVMRTRIRRRGRIAVTVRICTRVQPGTRGHGRRVD